MFLAHIKLIAATCDFFLFIQCSHLWFTWLIILLRPMFFLSYDVNLW
jgi:hypothetical protein